MKKIMLMVLVIICLLSGTLLAQDDDWNTFTSDDGLVTFQYPADWVTFEGEDGELSVTNNPNLTLEDVNDLDDLLPAGTVIMQIESSEQEEVRVDLIPVIGDMSPQFILGNFFMLLGFYSVFGGEQISLQALSDIDIEGFDAASSLKATLHNGEIYMAAVMSGEMWAVMTARSDSMEVHLETLEAILSTLELSKAEE